MDNDALDSMDQFKRTIATVLDGLWRLAPAAVQDGVGGGHARCGGDILRPHDADQDIERGSGMASRQRANFGQRFSHLRQPFWEVLINQAGSGDDVRLEDRD